MRTFPIVEGETGTGVSATFPLPSRSDEIIVQVEVTVSATIEVQGRLSTDAPWVILTTLTASGLQPLAAVSEFRLNITANGGTVNAWIGSR